MSEDMTSGLCVSDYLKYANLQMAAEAFLQVDGLQSYTGDDLIRALQQGNNHASVFTSTQASAFEKEWEVLSQDANTETGFSGTLFRNKNTGELVISFRSTEFIDDNARDNVATNALEIKDYGFAFGQIDDMQTWVDSLLNDPTKIPADAQVSVTGYSLGGHLATAFNMLYCATPTSSGEPLVKQVVTFNGAGVGVVNSATTLASVMQTFHDARNADFGLQIADPTLRNIYERTKASTAAGGTISAADMNAVGAMLRKVGDSYTVDDTTRQQEQWLQDAVGRIDTIRKDVTWVNDTVQPGNGSAPPNQVLNSQIAQESLDYQMAVLYAQQGTTDSASMVGGAVRAYDGKVVMNDPHLAPQYDVMGDTSPSLVSNSQWHVGTNVPVFIEDQPLVRGGYPLAAAQASFATWETQLLPQGYATSNFGDTHSLVLLVDSLMVSPQVRRRQLALARERGLSQRQACGLLAISRSTLSYELRLPAKDAPVIEGIKTLSAQ